MGAAGDAEEPREVLEARTSGEAAPSAAADRAAMLDPDYMAMVLAMDTLWAADDATAAAGLPEGEGPLIWQPSGAGAL